eukprot:jgi/Psemu1/52596/gm1.52596_g
MESARCTSRVTFTKHNVAVTGPSNHTILEGTCDPLRNLYMVPLHQPEQETEQTTHQRVTATTDTEYHTRDASDTTKNDAPRSPRVPANYKGGNPPPICPRTVSQILRVNLTWQNFLTP